MKIAKNIKSILCDDVRRETGNKISLMGIYSKDFIVNKIPAILPLINLVIMFESMKVKFKEVHIKLISPKADPIVIKYPAPKDIIIGKDLNIIIGISPFKINGEGLARFEIALLEHEKPIIIHEFLIKTPKDTKKPNKK
jgi:hypothetical protein